MNLEQAKAYRDKKLSEGHESDGCSFVPEFSFTPACQVHDFMIRFEQVSELRAHWLFLLAMLEIAGANLLLIVTAFVYYLGVIYLFSIFRNNVFLAVFVTVIGVTVALTTQG